ncbi:nitrogen fixation protein NifZ [Neisseria sicca]|uniref:nitrogen fixation protein NifZ n=1 Tax=Neisseria sicca TaxID=490 RepID=UPI001F0C5CC7|nr:nitrogen fixation protein NifZ [Neisseria sicca]
MEIQKDMAEFLMVSDDVGLLCGIGLKFIPSITRFAIHGKRSSENRNPVFRRPLF